MKHCSTVSQRYKANVTLPMQGYFTTVKPLLFFLLKRNQKSWLCHAFASSIVSHNQDRRQHSSAVSALEPPLSEPDLPRRADFTYRWMFAAARMAVRRQYLVQYMIPLTRGVCPGVPLNGSLSQPDNSLQFKSTWRPLKIWPAHNAMREPGNTEAQKGHD